MGDVQGKHQDDGEIKTITPSDPREKLGPPDRLAMYRGARPSYYVPPAAAAVVMIADSKVSSKRRGLASDSDTVSSEPAKEGSRKPSQFQPASGSTIHSLDDSSQARRGNESQPMSVPDKSWNKSTVTRPPGLQPKSRSIENKNQPLAAAITSGNLADKYFLVFEELDKVRTTEPTVVVGSFKDRTSPESPNRAVVGTTATMDRSGSSCSDGDSQGPGRRWFQRWCIDKVGREQGQIRCIKDLCMLRCGSIVATEPKNVRLQMFAKTGKSLSVIGPDTEDLRSSRSFGNPLTFRKMHPAGVVETVVDNLVAVTDLNRVLYIEATLEGMLDGEVKLKGKTDLRGIATTWSSKIIVTEVGSQASVGMYETSGKFIREFKGNFRKPCYVTYDPIYDITAVSDSEQGLVFLYDSSGNPLAKFGASKNPTGNRSSPGDLVYPSGLCWSNHGRLLVADEVQKKVVAFDLRNLTAETLLSAEDGLNRPVAIASDFRDTRNRIYVAEEFLDFGVNKYYLKMFEQRLTNVSTS